MFIDIVSIRMKELAEKTFNCVFGNVATNNDMAEKIPKMLSLDNVKYFLFAADKKKCSECLFKSLYTGSMIRGDLYWTFWKNS